MQATLAQYYNLDYNTYADYYVDYLAVACTLLNIVRYHEGENVPKDKAILLYDLSKTLTASMNTAAALLARLDDDMKAEKTLLKKIESDICSRG